MSKLYEKYLEVQNQNTNKVIVIRLGDFYEVFGDDAKKIADKLNLTLTSRNCGLENRIPMVGFPYCVKDEYFTAIEQVTNKTVFELEV